MTTPTVSLDDHDDDGAATRAGRLAAVVLSGGRGSRLGGASKAALEVGGVPLLDGVLDALAAAGVTPVVVVGEEPVGGPRPGVVVVRENPPFAGPLAAVATGISALGTSVPASGTTDDGTSDAETYDGDTAPPTATSPRAVLLLACDLPRAADLVPLLVRLPVPEGSDGALLVDPRRQWLAARYDLAALTAACHAAAAETADGTLTGLPLRAALGRLRLLEVPDTTGVSADVDTPEDLVRARGSNP